MIQPQQTMTTATPADDEATPADDDDATPTDDDDATPTDDDDAAPTDDDDATPAEDDDATPAEDDDATPAEDDDATTAEDGDATPTDDEATPTDDEATPTDDDSAPTDDDDATPAEDGDATPTDDDDATPTDDDSAPTDDDDATPTDDEATPANSTSQEKGKWGKKIYKEITKIQYLIDMCSSENLSRKIPGFSGKPDWNKYLKDTKNSLSTKQSHWGETNFTILKNIRNAFLTQCNFEEGQWESHPNWPTVWQQINKIQKEKGKWNQYSFKTLKENKSNLLKKCQLEKATWPALKSLHIILGDAGASKTASTLKKGEWGRNIYGLTQEIEQIFENCKNSEKVKSQDSED